MFNLKINNFRSFQNQSFEFSRVNILIGENSGGKSSLLKFLLALKQTLDSPQESNLKLKGDFTDLGNYEEVIYQNNTENNIEFEFSNKDEYLDYFITFIDNLDETEQFDLEKFIHTVEPFFEKETKISFRLSKRLHEHSSIETIIENEIAGKIELTQSKEKLEDYYRDIPCDIKYYYSNSKIEIRKCSSYKEGFFTLFAWDLQKKIEELYPNESNHFYYPILYLLSFQNYIINHIERIRYVNPINSSPKRFYFKEDKKASYRLIDIEKFINIIGDSALPQKESVKRMKLLNSAIKKLGIADEIKIVKNQELPILALNVRTKGEWCNITDVGYGVSLQIPILFQAILSENNTENGENILIEQPEVHLHPKLQSSFIETLLDIGNKNTYFIETHSEHIVRKLQVLVKNKDYELTSKDVNIYYFRRESGLFEISRHIIQEDGSLLPCFPNGFYDASYSLVKDLL